MSDAEVRFETTHAITTIRGALFAPIQRFCYALGFGAIQDLQRLTPSRRRFAQTAIDDFFERHKAFDPRLTKKRKQVMLSVGPDHPIQYVQMCYSLTSADRTLEDVCYPQYNTLRPGKRIPIGDILAMAAHGEEGTDVLFFHELGVRETRVPAASSEEILMAATTRAPSVARYRQILRQHSRTFDRRLLVYGGGGAG